MLLLERFFRGAGGGAREPCNVGEKRYVPVKEVAEASHGKRRDDGANS